MIRVLVASVLWGISGTAAQELFVRFKMDPMWLLWCRMLAGGLVLVAALILRGNLPRLKTLLASKRDVWHMIVYAIFGLGLVQMTYLLGISDGNAVAATVLQFLAPVLLSFYLAIKAAKVPRIGEMLTLILAVGGTVLLLSNGKLGTLVVPLSAIGWGLGSAVASAFNTYFPTRLIRSYGPILVVATASVFDGVVLGPLEITKSLPPMNQFADLLLIFIVVFGTALPWALFLSSLPHLAPVEAVVILGAEPISSAVVGVSLLNAPFGPLGLLGGLATILAVVQLTRSKDHDPVKPLF